MSFKEVSNQPVDVKGFKGEPFEGVFIGSKKIKTKMGEQTIYTFQKIGGSKFSVYGFTNLNRAMDMVSINQLVRIVYNGTEKVETNFGLKDVHQCSVQVDEDYKHEDTEGEDPF